MTPNQPDYSSAVAHLKAADERIAAMIERVGPCELHVRHEHSIFYTLLRSIVYQQLAGSAAAAILARVERAIHGDAEMPTAERLLDTPDDVLRAAGLSRNKLLAVKDLAAKTLDGTVPSWPAISKMSEEEIIERCVQVRGIGRWTVEMLLIFRLGRLDVLPVDDYGVRKGLQFTYRMRSLPNKKQMIKKAERLRPYRSIASWYFWQVADMPEFRKKKATAPKRAASKKSSAKSKAATKKSGRAATRTSRQNPDDNCRSRERKRSGS
jgi:3-methyladenine DNA glycosylase/8-oxoguanine DNA glycosylase